jgi:hypothetical protein
MAIAVEENADTPIAVARILRRQLLHPRPSFAAFRLRYSNAEPPILRLELPQPLEIARLQTTEALAPGVDRLLADAVPPPPPPPPPPDRDPPPG